MNNKEKKQIERKLKLYNTKKARLQNRLIDEAREPISAMTYDDVFTSETNDFYSIVEEVVESRENISEETKELMIELHKINNCLNALTPKEYDLINDKYFNDKTYEEMADGTYDTYRWRTIYDWIKKILEKFNIILN